MGFCLSACAEVGLSKGCQPLWVPPPWVWDGTSKPGYSPGPWQALCTGRGLASKDEKSGEKKQWEGAAKGSCLTPSGFALANVTMHLRGDKQWVVHPKSYHTRTIHGISVVFTPGLTTFPLFPALMEVSEELFPPFAPGASTKIHLFLNKISSKSSPNSK